MLELCTSLLACPNCKDALNEQVSMAFALSIGFMILIPVIILASWAAAIWYLAKSSHKPTFDGRSQLLLPADVKVVGTFDRIELD